MRYLGLRHARYVHDWLDVHGVDRTQLGTMITAGNASPPTDIRNLQRLAIRADLHRIITIGHERMSVAGAIHTFVKCRVIATAVLTTANLSSFYVAKVFEYLMR